MRTQKKMLMAAVLAASLVGMSTGPVMADEDGKDEGPRSSSRSCRLANGVCWRGPGCGGRRSISSPSASTHWFPMGRTGQSQRAGVAAPHLR